MADETSTEKVKQTVPGMERSAHGVAEHAALALNMYYDRERRVFKDPIMPLVALFAYIKVLGNLLHEAEMRLNASAEALALRIEKLETQIAAFEEWRALAETQGAAMVNELEEMMNGGGDPLAKLKSMVNEGGSSLPPKSDDKATTVVPLKPEGAKKREPKTDEKHGEKGGAA